MECRASGRWTAAGELARADANRPLGAPGPVYSARKLLESFAASKRTREHDRLQRAMCSRDLDTVRVMLARHARLCRIETTGARYSPVGQTMRPRGWSGRDMRGRTPTRPQVAMIEAGSTGATARAEIDCAQLVATP